MVRRFFSLARLGSDMADDRPAVAALRVSRPHQTAMPYVWDDAMRDPILSGPFSRRIQVESAHFHSALRRNRLRCLRTGDIGDALAAFADPFFE